MLRCKFHLFSFIYLIYFEDKFIIPMILYIAYTEYFNLILIKPRFYKQSRGMRVYTLFLLYLFILKLRI